MPHADATTKDSIWPATQTMPMVDELALKDQSRDRPILPNAEHTYEVTRTDLPLCCPMPGMALWNSHPRVYLSIVDDGGTSRCPYCSATYILRD